MQSVPLYVFYFVLMLLGTQRPPERVISCAPAVTAFTGSITSVRNGNWSDPGTWGGRVPGPKDAPVIADGHIVQVDANVVVAGMQVAGQLTFDPSRSITFSSSKNILVTGQLQMKAASPVITHTLRFTGINENNFEGGGMDMLDSDIGLWVMEMGQLQLQGQEKTAWTNAIGAIAAGATTITVRDATGWRVGDELLITPTAANARNVDVRTITAIKGNTVSVNAATTAHPLINNLWTAEVGNLSRNIRVEGSATGRSHIFIRSAIPQMVKHVAFRYLGPRKSMGRTEVKDQVQGRYGLHFHHCNDGSDGSMVEGCVMRDIDNHAYVPHVSHGITMRHNIAYNCTDAPFWWDLPDATHRTVWTHNLVVAPKYVQGALSLDTKGSPTFGTHGFVLSMGDDNRCDSNVVAGQQGLETVNAAYDWEEMPIESAWIFKGNIAHNSDCGIRSWQNNGKNHVLEQTIIYNCRVGVMHGAYVNNYTYNGGYLYNSVFEDHAASGANGVRIENMILDGDSQIPYPFTMVEGPAKGERPVLLRNCTIKGGTKGAILNGSSNAVKSLDVVQCDIRGHITLAPNAGKEEVIRVQPVKGAAYTITKSGKKEGTAFAPLILGSGAGLKGAYYNGTDWNDLVEARIDPLISFPEWRLPMPGLATGVHYKIKDTRYSIRFTGFIEPQYTEEYIFSTEVAGGVRLWVNDTLLIDRWRDEYTTTHTSPAIALEAGKKYAIRLEYFNQDDRSSLYLFWQSASLPRELVPQSQLYGE
ncbi:PA14 domain-containing protein [Niastella caeni]|nr:PA14 domain-containing protein [Niastella caeni]